jgi:hypothetical protein
MTSPSKSSLKKLVTWSWPAPLRAVAQRSAFQLSPWTPYQCSSRQRFSSFCLALLLLWHSFLYLWVDVEGLHQILTLHQIPTLHRISTLYQSLTLHRSLTPDRRYLKVECSATLRKGAKVSKIWSHGTEYRALDTSNLDKYWKCQHCKNDKLLKITDGTNTNTSHAIRHLLQRMRESL